MSKVIAVDFDGTITDHSYPEIGEENPGAIDALQAMMDSGHRLILYTMRSGEYLAEAVEWCRQRNVVFWGINENPDQKEWTESPKVHADLYIDDRGAGVPLRFPLNSKPMVSWNELSYKLRNYRLITDQADVGDILD